MLKALIFDVDGTLSETEETHRAAFNQAFSESGLDWEWNQTLYGRLLDVTGGKERIRLYLEDFDPPRVPGLPSDQQALNGWIAALHARKTAIYNELVAAGAATLRPGVEALMRHACNTGMRLAIATTTSLPNVESLLRATLGEASISYFSAIAAGDMVMAKKPAPDVYRLALELLRLEPEHCLALEDSENGLESARRAGLPVVVTRSVYTAHQNFEGARDAVSSLDEYAGPAAGTAVEGGAILARLRELVGGS